MSAADEAQQGRGGREAAGDTAGTSAQSTGAPGDPPQQQRARRSLADSLQHALQIVKSTPRHAKKSTMGWFGLDEFVELVQDPRVTV